MALPKQVQQQADAVAEYDKQFAEQAAANQEPQSEPAETPQPSPSTEPPANAPASTAQPQPVPDDWEQKYRSLYGMIQRESREKQIAQQELQALKERLDAMQQQMKPPQAEAPEPLVSEKDVEAFGSDLIDMARRVAREEFGTREQAYVTRIATLETQVQKQVGEVQQTQAHTSRETFFANLGREVPTWQQIQATDACQQWLASRVPGAAFTWNDVLVNAADNFDVARATEVFTTFIGTQPKPPAPPAVPSRVRTELARQVTPSRTSNAAPISNADKHVYSTDEYANQSNQIIRLTKAGKYEDAARIEQELNAALLEGRVRP